MSRLTLDSYCGVDDSDDDRGYDDYGLDDEHQQEDDFDDFMRLRPRQASLHTSHLFFLKIFLELIQCIACFADPDWPGPVWRIRIRCFVDPRIWDPDPGWKNPDPGSGLNIPDLIFEKLE
jgi:hypothetical protein